MKHKHYDFIVAWANGAEIEYLDNALNSVWHQTKEPAWREHYQYRIKPVPKPDVVRYAFVTKSVAHQDNCPDNNLMLTFSGETGKLIKAEVLK